MADSYDTIAALAWDEFVEKRSRFIGAISPVTDEKEAQAFVTSKKAEHHSARHSCYAYTLREGGVLRYSDDGEPQGTAGMPMLEVIRREGLWDVAVVVTRYFGGILLGAGGLVRAYTQGAKLAVDAAKRVTMCPCTIFMLECPYPLYEQVQILLEQHGTVVLDTDFGSSVTFTARIRDELVEPLQLQLTELSGGQLELLVMGHEFAAI